MDSRELAAFLSALISELLLTITPFLFHSSIPLTITSSNSYGTLFPLLQHFVSDSEIVTSLPFLSVSGKRKRTDELQNPEPLFIQKEKTPELGPLVWIDSPIPRNPDSFKLCFRMTSSTFEWLASILEPLLECRDPVPSPLNLTAETRLGIGLFLLSTGADYPEIASRFGVSDSVAKFCVKQLCRVLCTNFRFWVGFPSPLELVSVSSAFESLTGIPNCCGVIACTRYRIARNGYDPSKTEEVQGPSIAAQLVVDSSSRILSIAAGFGGNNSDWAILKSSSLYKDIESGRLLDLPPLSINNVSLPQYLVGDRKYPLRPWLITPFPEPVPGRKHEEIFNVAHNLMRLPAIKTVASLKNWGVLNKPIEAEFKTAVAYIGACSILHNVLLMREDYSALCDELAHESTNSKSDQGYMEAGLEKSSIGEKGSVIRTALAARAKEVTK